MSRMGERLANAMQEAVEHSEGKIDLRTSQFNISPVCEEIRPETIKKIREKLGMSQGVFAVVVGVSKKTVESWESGRYMPDGAARRLIMVMQQDPSFPEKYGILQRV